LFDKFLDKYFTDSLLGKSLVLLNMKGNLVVVEDNELYDEWRSALEKLNKATGEREAAEKAKLSSNFVSKLRSIEIGAQQAYNSISSKLE
jgi:hypothetical protein